MLSGRELLEPLRPAPPTPISDRRLAVGTRQFPLELLEQAFVRTDTDKAIAMFRKAIEVKPDYLLAHAHLADMLRHLERNEEAYREYEKVLELEPANSADLAAFDDALYRMATLDMQNGAYARAGQLLAELIRANPEHPSAYYALGQVLLHLGRPEEAQKAFDEHQRILARQVPSSPMAHGGE